MDCSDDIFQYLSGHIDAVWPANDKQAFTWQFGRIGRVLPNFSVIRVEPASTEEPWIYVTHGAWEVDMEKPYRLEFVLLSPHETPLHIETLAMLATYHAEE